MAVSCMRNASGHNYRNNSVIVDLVMWQMPRSTERITSFFTALHGMQTRSSDDNSIRPSVCLSVCHTREL